MGIDIVKIANPFICVGSKTSFLSEKKKVIKSEVEKNNKTSDIEFSFFGNSDFENVENVKIEEIDELKSDIISSEHSKKIIFLVEKLKNQKIFFNFLIKKNIDKFIRMNIVLPEGCNFQPGIFFKKKNIKNKKYTITEQKKKNKKKLQFKVTFIFLV